MTVPLQKHWNLLKRLGRYLVGRERMVVCYQWQGGEGIRAYSDSDWAGCKRTARSASGGVITRGNHFLKSWSATPKRVTLSSAEAELGALVKTTTEAIGLMQLVSGLGKELEAEILVDTSAALRWG